MVLKRIGHYKELTYGEATDPSILDSVGAKLSYKKEICNYLKNGIVIAACAGVVEDVIHPEKGIIGSPNCLTDGTWMWYADLAYYVSEYDLALDNDFVEHMKNNSWKIPENIDIDFENIEVT